MNYSTVANQKFPFDEKGWEKSIDKLLQCRLHHYVNLFTVDTRKQSRITNPIDFLDYFSLFSDKIKFLLQKLNLAFIFCSNKSNCVSIAQNDSNLSSLQITRVNRFQIN